MPPRPHQRVSESHLGWAWPTIHAPSNVMSRPKGRPPLLGPSRGSTALKSEDQGFSHLNPMPLPPFPWAAPPLAVASRWGKRRDAETPRPGGGWFLQISHGRGKTSHTGAPNERKGFFPTSVLGPSPQRQRLPRASRVSFLVNRCVSLRPI